MTFGFGCVFSKDVQDSIVHSFMENSIEDFIRHHLGKIIVFITAVLLILTVGAYVEIL
jgi:hypothetical protein